jgi:thiol-disulfide isomerase/thioredoxin
MAVVALAALTALAIVAWLRCHPTPPLNGSGDVHAPTLEQSRVLLATPCPPGDARCARGGALRAQDKAAYTEGARAIVAQQLRGGGRALLFVFAPWCGHCHRAMPDVAAAANDVPTVPVVAVNADMVDNELLEEYGVRHFPYVVLLRPGGAARPLEGSVSREALARFARA